MLPSTGGPLDDFSGEYFAARARHRGVFLR